MDGRMGVVTGRYRSYERSTADGKGPQTILELFGRMDDGRSICLLAKGQRPTFEVAPIGPWDIDEEIPPFLADRIKSLMKMEHVVGVEGPVVKLTELGDRPVWTVEVEQPFHVPSLRKKLRSQSWRIFSGDIPFVNRLFLDGDLGVHIGFKGDLIDERGGPEDGENRVLEAGGAGRYPVDVTVVCHVDDLKASEPFQVPFRMFSFDLETSIEHETVLCAAAWIEDLATGDRKSFSYRGDEATILQELTELVRAHDPDIITGYNIDNFDLPRLADRTAALTKKKDWKAQSQLLGWGRTPVLESEMKRNRDALVPKRQTNRAWNVAGRAVMDAWWQARQALKPRRETLSFVATLLFPNDEDKHKMDVDASNMDHEWATRPDEVMEYCVRDAELPLDILQAIQAVRRKEAVASVAKVPFETAANGSTSQLIDSLVIRLADSKHVAVPLTGSAEAKEGQITGGYVHDVEAGLHPWIAVLDFKSMYPSIMIGHNICYTTRVDPGQPDQPLEGEEVHTAPTGAVFRHQSSRKGLVPELLEMLMAKRDQHKAALKISKSSGDQGSFEFHDAMQYAVKILMNSFYGVFASGFYRFTHRDLGSSITAWARQNIKTIIAALDDEGHGVVYSDTDSIFVRSPVGKDAPSYLSEDDLDAIDRNDPEGLAKQAKFQEALDGMVSFGQQIAQRFSKASAVLEFERGLSVFFSHGAKKRYIGQVVWPTNEMLVRGYETQRTDSFAYLTATMKEIFSYALADQGEALVDYALSRVQALKNKEVDASELILAKSCKGKIVRTPVKDIGDVDFTKDYVNPNSMAQVRVAQQRIKSGLGFTSGMKVSYVVVNANHRPMNVVPWYEAEEDGGISGYDGQFYAERLATAVGRITEVFGWSAKDLYTGNRQTSLFSF